MYFFFFFNDTATTEIYTLSLHDALPIFEQHAELGVDVLDVLLQPVLQVVGLEHADLGVEAVEERDVARLVGDLRAQERSEEHTSELQSRQYLVCRLLLEKKKKLRKHLQF